VALSATIAGARSFVAIAEWAADATPHALAQLGVTAAVPSESMIRRCLQRLAPDQLDELIAAWMWLRISEICGRRVIAFDGKTLRGALDDAGNLVHLLAGLCQHTGTVLAQIAVGAKTNEIPLLVKALDLVDIAGAVIAADALHCQRGTAEVIIGRGHGRTAKRVLKATEIAEGITFPGAVQVLQLTRSVTDRKTGKRRSETVYAVTSMSATDAHPNQIADWLRGHWHIENRLHWVRDVTYPEDHYADQNRRRTPSDGNPAQHRAQPAPPGWPRQHRRSPQTPRPGPSPTGPTTAEMRPCRGPGVRSSMGFDAVTRDESVIVG